MAGQYSQLVNKQYNSPIHLYSDRNVREILERETKVLSNGAIGIDFNNPMANKPANLQNSAVLRMLEEEENRKRSGQPGSIENNSKPLRDQIVWPPKPNVKRHTTLKDVTISGLKRVAWPPPSDSEEFVEQEPVQSQGGPQFSSKSESTSQNNQPQLQQPLTSPALQQQSQQPKPPITTNNTFQPIISPTASSSLSGAQSPYQSAPLSPNVNKSPVSFSTLAKPWSPQGRSTPQFKPVQPPSLRTVQSYHSSEQYQYQSQGNIRETQTLISPSYQQEHRTSQRETTFQQYQTPPIVEQQRSYETIKTQQEHQSFPQSGYTDLSKNVTEHIQESVVEVSKPAAKLPSTIQAQQGAPKSETFIQIIREPATIVQESPKPATNVPLAKFVTTEKVVTPPIQSQVSAAAQGIAQNQIPAQPRYQPAPVKQVEPPPSTITLRPQAPVSQAPPPLVTSQPATATLRGGKNLRGDMKWPPENVRERMAAEQQHLEELSRGPAFKPRKNCKDYSAFFAKHALGGAYPGYKIPPGTQFYEHNPVM